MRESETPRAEQPVRTVDASSAATSSADHQHRRERELHSLYATARSLTALVDVDTVLASIVRHARDLIGTDVTYLSVFDEGRTALTLRAVDGSLSPAFRSAHVPANTGVGGRVVQTQAAVWVKNYLADDSLVHDADFDRVLRAEGIMALLGVPLRKGQEVFGILYAADRIERPFGIDEVALLSAFADHAAVALQNARLYEESKRALADLRDAYATIERSEHMHDALTRVVLTGGGAGEVAELLAASLGGTVAIYDRDNQLVVNTSAADEQPSFPSKDLASTLEDSRRSGRCVTSTDSAGAHHTIAPILAGDAYLGLVVQSAPSHLFDAEQRALERAGQILALLTLKQNALVEAQERVRGELLADVITSLRPYSAELLARANSRGLPAGRVNAVVIVACEVIQPGALVRQLHTVAGEWPALVGLHQGKATMVLDTQDVNKATAAVHRSLRASLRAPVIVSAAAVQATHQSLQRPFEIASRCIKILRRLGIEDRAVSASQLGVYALAFDPDRGDDLQQFLTETLGPLLDYDAQRNSDLVQTLAAYFNNSTNLTKTSEALHVHLNTLVKRLNRISSVIGPDWQEPPRALPLQLAAQLSMLTRSEGKA
ncbi:helix-turn-helix domain-containing protein [Arthrobacter globiformis]|uniref:helix-turn-helix domain-containing protein n=1 Tax=Arthrobacter globiformis TaxID=1665 RepID=UPI002792DFE6|nr:GAF domain-containing protein [Arthrobacter globiformis]MDQ0618394.1 GAF domain-containing protein [Arthrobacter globiformis]